MHHVGERFGKLIIESDSGLRSNKNVVWVCKCDCGNVVQRNTNVLSMRHSNSCGCNRRNPRFSKRLNDAPQRRSFSMYQTSAERRGYSFNLSLEEFKNICSSACYYCGVIPSREVKTKHNNLFMNGIDRVDNTKGYEVVNCVPCCGICNRMKHNLSIEKFMEHIGKVYHSSRFKKAANYDGYRGAQP